MVTTVKVQRALCECALHVTIIINPRITVMDFTLCKKRDIMMGYDLCVQQMIMFFEVSQGGGGNSRRVSS